MVWLYQEHLLEQISINLKIKNSTPPQTKTKTWTRQLKTKNTGLRLCRQVRFYQN